ncbi:hypothetical protein, partial [Achromobacter xylosoxidans]|uniref:hypothetical protein n=1 Tax=Alcaligenes xylosoxydans xylosoxydans TaxID=85698 RepID=UPI001F1A2B3C
GKAQRQGQAGQSAWGLSVDGIAAHAAGGEMSHGRPFDPTGIGIRVPLLTMTLDIRGPDSVSSAFL